MIDFDTIYDHIIPLDNFSLKWRFSENSGDVIAAVHLEQFKPLDNQAARFLWDYISTTCLHDDDPFKTGFFTKIDETTIHEENNKEIRRWLYHRGLPFSKDVFLSWRPDEAMIVPWKIVVKYFDSFYFSVSDDLTVIDGGLSWALLFHHTDKIYFGSNT